MTNEDTKEIEMSEGTSRRGHSSTEIYDENLSTSTEDLHTETGCGDRFEHMG